MLLLLILVLIIFLLYHPVEGFTPSLYYGCVQCLRGSRDPLTCEECTGHLCDPNDTACHRRARSACTALTIGGSPTAACTAFRF